MVERERVFIAFKTGIEVWPLWGYKRLFKIPIDGEECAWCVVDISEDGRLIVAGHEDGTVRRWDAHTGEPVGKAMYNLTGEVKSVSIRGKLIVSGSWDGFFISLQRDYR